jgi:hypothetical protein
MYCTGSRRRSILGRIVRMRRILRPQRADQNRILKLSIDELEELGIDIVCVEPHFVFSFVSRLRSNGPPIASTVHNISLRSNVSRNCLTYTQPQLSQKLKDRSRSPQIYCLVTAFGFVSIFTSSGW